MHTYRNPAFEHSSLSGSNARGFNFRISLFACLLTVLTIVSTATSSKADAILLPITPYYSFIDSPFAQVFADKKFGYFYLEDFEHGEILAPGVSISPGGYFYGFTEMTDSVDEDDGAVDGVGNLGYSYYSGGVLSEQEFTFDETVLGGLPTHVGIVWTDVGFSSPDVGYGNVSLSIFDSAGLHVGTVGPVLLGDGSSLSNVDDHRFFGAIYASGISRVVMAMDNSTDWELDHLQFGLAVDSTEVPEPATLALLSLATLGGFGLRRRVSY